MSCKNCTCASCRPPAPPPVPAPAVPPPYCDRDMPLTVGGTFMAPMEFWEPRNGGGVIVKMWPFTVVLR